MTRSLVKASTVMVVSRAASTKSMTLVTIGIAVAPYHYNIVGRALQSVKEQTIPCAVLVQEDPHQYGAGYTRNRILEQVTTPFVAFLDADDTIEPNYAELMLKHYEQGKYIYCDDYAPQRIHTTPDCDVYVFPESWHCVTALLTTAHAQYVGGFDETLPGMEDADFFLRLQANGICGRRCPYPLVYYSWQGQRSGEFIKRNDYVKIRQAIQDRSYGEARRMCSCTDKVVNNGAIGGQQDGDILVYAPQKLNRFNGRITGREYQRPRSADNYRVWVNPLDQQADPTNLQLVDIYDPKKHAPDVDSIQRMVSEALSA